MNNQSRKILVTTVIMVAIIASLGCPDALNTELRPKYK